MKYILIILLFASCSGQFTAIKLNKYLFIVNSIEREGTYCLYISPSPFMKDNGILIDDCDKYQIGDTVTTCKYTRK